MIRSIVIFWIFFLLLLAGMGFWVHSLSETNADLNGAFEAQTDLLERQAEQISALQSGEQAHQLIDFVQRIQADLDSGEDHRLSERNITDIISLSKALSSFRYPDGDSLVEVPLSPARGQLLAALVKMGLDSIDFTKIKAGATFAYADLHNADLHGADLSGADLSYAHLKNTNLSGSNLSGASLLEANLWNADLSRADLRKADVRRADVRWSKMTLANLHEANLNGARMDASLMDGADLREADVRWAQFAGAVMTDADLEGLNLKGAVFDRANLKGVRLCKARFSRTALTEAIFGDTDLDSAVVEEENWMQALNDVHAIGVAAIQSKYRVTPSAKGSTFYVVPRED
ncbi:MAG: pentapeptide repeat-containing protein [Flavobacteriales bacterium]|nr:pentapeptide repeat-containing protein [Flavobacteriales bacterium]